MKNKEEYILFRKNYFNVIDPKKILERRLEEVRWYAEIIIEDDLEQDEEDVLFNEIETPTKLQEFKCKILYIKTSIVEIIREKLFYLAWFKGSRIAMWLIS